MFWVAFVTRQFLSWRRASGERSPSHARSSTMAAAATSYSCLVTKHDQVLVSRPVLIAEASLRMLCGTSGPSALLERLADGYANNVGAFNPTLPFMGRAEEFDLLVAALDDARRGRAVAVFVSGETGVGKSRLLREFTADAERQGVAVLQGAAIDVTEDAPFWPVRGALRIFLRDPRHDWAVELLKPWWDELKVMLATGLRGTAGRSCILCLDYPGHAGAGHRGAI